MRTISFRQQALLKEAGPKERKRSSGLNFDFAKSELGRSGSEVSKDVIQKYLDLEENKDKLPISDSDLSKINDLNLNESARKRVNEEEAFFLIIGAVKSGDNETESINAINEYLNRAEFQSGDLKTNWMRGVNLLDLNSIVAAWNDFYSEVKREKEEVRRKKLESKKEDYISNKIVYDDFGDGWRVVYVPAIGEIEEYPGLPNTSHDRILEGNKNGLCLGSQLKLYQDNGEGKIFSVRDPNNKPEVTIRIADNVLQEAKGKQNSSPSVEGAIHAVRWFETIKGLSYQYSDDYGNFPPLSAEEAKNEFLSNLDDSYKRGWISSWYGKGISEIDEDVRRRIADNDPLVFVLAEKHHKLIKPVAQFWFKALNKKFNNDVYREIIDYNLHKLYKDLPEIIQFGESIAKSDPYYFLDNFTNEPWVQTYLPIAAKSYAEKYPAHFLNKYINEPWAKEHFPLAAKNLVESDPDAFLSDFINEPWAKEHIPLAAKNLAESEPSTFLYYFINEPWAEPYIPTAAKHFAVNSPYYFLSNFADKPWAKPYILLAGKSVAESNPSTFLHYFSDEPWANEQMEDLDGKSFVQYAKEMLQKQSSYSTKLTKLAKVLRSFGLSKEATSILNLK